jgi:hypothetical protein
LSEGEPAHPLGVAQHPVPLEVLRDVSLPLVEPEGLLHLGRHAGHEVLRPA